MADSSGGAAREGAEAGESGRPHVEQRLPRFTIYGLVDPRDGSIRYVGRTVDPRERLYAHCSSSGCASLGGSGKARQDWLRELRGLGLRPTLRELEYVETFELAIEAEEQWIAFGLARKWPLTNRHRSGRAGGWAGISRLNASPSPSSAQDRGVA